MDKIFIQTHIIGQEKIFILIQIRDYKIQPLSARLRTRETKSPTWVSTTSILHLSIESSQEKGKLGKNTKVLQGTKGCRLKYKFWQQWTIVSLLSILSYAFNVPRGSLYSFPKGQWKVESEWSQGIGKARSQVSWIHVKENSKGIWILHTSWCTMF